MKIGWNFVIETTNGIVGLWSCWLGNSFKLFYPLEVQIPDKLIMDTLEVEYAKPVKNELFGTRLWNKYYSERLDTLGRIWIGQESDHSYGYNLNVIENRQIKEYYCGHNVTNTVFTNDFTFCSENEPDAPNAHHKYIEPYKDKFIKLLVEVAKLVGDIKAVNLDSGLVLYTPDTLKSMGYSIQMSGGEYEKYCYAKNEEKNIEIMLKSGNSVVSWLTIIRYLSTNDLTAKDLIELLDSFDNSNDFFNPIPLVAHLLEQEAMYNK